MIIIGNLHLYSELMFHAELDAVRIEGLLS